MKVNITRPNLSKEEREQREKKFKQALREYYREVDKHGERSNVNR